jgi:hypothetical protein
VAALSQTPLIIVDHRLTAAQSPVIDWRALGAGGASGAGAPQPGAAAAPKVTEQDLIPEVETNN